MLMKYIFYILFILGITSCSYDYRLSSLNHRKLTYKELPDSVRMLLYSAALGVIEDNQLLFVNPSDSSVYHYEVVWSIFVSSWVDYCKLIDTDRNIIYRIEQGEPSPYIIDSNANKLYIPSDYIFLTRISLAYDSIKKQKDIDSADVAESIVVAANKEIYNAIFTEYELK